MMMNGNEIEKRIEKNFFIETDFETSNLSQSVIKEKEEYANYPGEIP
jgi:hypothetical protein